MAFWTTAADAAMPAPVWLPAWYASPEPVGGTVPELKDTTLRQIVRVSADGHMVRLRLSNAYGAEPLHIDAVHVARRDTGSRIDPASDRDVTFSGKSGVTVAPGAYALSDPIALDVAADSDLAVSLYVRDATRMATVHDMQRDVLYVAPGDQTAAAVLPETKTDIGLGSAFPWLNEVEVSGSHDTATVITFGDSITDGFGIDRDQGGTWPELLSRRLHAQGYPLGVANAGLSGNRLEHNGQWARFGDAGLARFDRDVLAQPNVAAVIVLIGINDLGHAGAAGSPEFESAEDMIMGLTQLAQRAHERGLRAYAATLTPFVGTVFTNYYSDEKETRRQAINAWIRSQTVFDGVIDFDKALDDPAAPGHLPAAFDHGDHLHPSMAGLAAMANAVPLDLFDWARPAAKPASKPGHSAGRHR
jgi:lysophospholipase L1-like esterase